jgi:hypothetical protein
VYAINHYSWEGEILSYDDDFFMQDFNRQRSFSQIAGDQKDFNGLFKNGRGYVNDFIKIDLLIIEQEERMTNGHLIGIEEKEHSDSRPFILIVFYYEGVKN